MDNQSSESYLNQRSESYLNHPSFGLLYRVCTVGDNQDIYTTLYAQRLFFLVTISKDSFVFEPVTRNDARLLVEKRIRELRYMTKMLEAQELQKINQRTFL